MEHLDNCASAHDCQRACQLLSQCKFFNYDKHHKDCELLITTDRKSDLIRGPPQPRFDECWDDGSILWKYEILENHGHDDHLSHFK